MSQMMPDVTPYHYPPVLKELTQALADVLHASDWREGAAVSPAPGLTEEDRRRAELGNVKAATSHVVNAFRALTARSETLATDVLLQEHADMAKAAPAIAQAIATTPTEHLPPELRADG